VLHCGRIFWKLIWPPWFDRSLSNLRWAFLYRYLCSAFVISSIRHLQPLCSSFLSILPLPPSVTSDRSFGFRKYFPRTGKNCLKCTYTDLICVLQVNSKIKKCLFLCDGFPRIPSSIWLFLGPFCQHISQSFYHTAPTGLYVHTLLLFPPVSHTIYISLSRFHWCL
jgi:hypothetical protein